MRLLVVEDDPKIGRFVAKGLEQESHVVDWVQDGEAGLDAALYGPYDAAVVDIMLPRRDGLSLVEEVRKARIALPIIILSAKDAVQDRVRGLELGADDYLTKPFSFAELKARLQAVLRRRPEGGGTMERELCYGDLVLDMRTRKARRGQAAIELPPKELTLLELFLRHPEQVLTKTMILEQVWEYAFDPQTNVVDVLVSRLRKKVDKDFDTKLIHTVRGVGYVLRAD